MDWTIPKSRASVWTVRPVQSGWRDLLRKAWQVPRPISVLLLGRGSRAVHSIRNDCRDHATAAIRVPTNTATKNKEPAPCATQSSVPAVSFLLFW